MFSSTNKLRATMAALAAVGTTSLALAAGPANAGNNAPAATPTEHITFTFGKLGVVYTQQ